MKREIVIVLTLFAILAAVSGCQSAEQDYYTTLTETVNEGIDATGVVGDKIIDALRQSKAVPEERLAAIEATMTSTAETVNIIQNATLEAAKVYDAESNEDKIGALIDAAIVANTASAPINPYAPAIGGLLAVLGGGYGALKRNEAIASRGKYQSHKQGVDSFMVNNVENASKLYDEIGKARARNGVP